MYSLIVSGTADAWGPGRSSGGLLHGRFLEYTSDELRARFETLDQKAKADLCALPVIFAYESGLGKFAQVGSITNIAGSPKAITIHFDINQGSPLLHLPKLRRELQIDEYELHRTHWAVKDVDLSALLEAMPAAFDGPRLRGDANPIALRAVRAILDGAEPFEVEVAGKSISLKVERLPAKAWPAGAWAMTEREDGPWPQPVRFRCEWDGGATDIVATAELAGGKYEGAVSLLVAAQMNSQMLVWLNIATQLKDGLEAVQFKASYSLAKRIPEETTERQKLERRRVAVRMLVAKSDLPRPSDASMEAFTVEVPRGDVRPTAKVAARRLAHLALLKLPFWTPVQSDVIDGTPYLDPDEHWLASAPAVDDSMVDETGGLEEMDGDDPAESGVSPILSVDPENWGPFAVNLDKTRVSEYAKARTLQLSGPTIAQVCAALSSGKHLMLVGPPIPAT
jgi:hypothetical protein